jgi:hypothetical protein
MQAPLALTQGSAALASAFNGLHLRPLTLETGGEGECYTHSLGCISTYTGHLTPVLDNTNFADLLFR